MKKLFLLNFNTLFFVALLILVTVNILGVYSEDLFLLKTTKSLFIPTLLILFLLKSKKLSMPFIFFFIFSFFGDLSVAFIQNQDFIKISSAFYFLSYISLIGLVIPKLNFFATDKVIGTYLTLMFLISAYFTFVFYDILKSFVPDSLEVILFGAKSISLIVLMVLALGKYLYNESKPSILFLIVAFCLLFSTALNYVGLYYVYNWSFEVIERVIYAIGIYFLLNYIILNNKFNIIQDNKGYCNSSSLLLKQ